MVKTYSVLVPHSATPTEWHPTGAEPLVRGRFLTEDAAHAWAAEHLAGNPYTLKTYEEPED